MKHAISDCFNQAFKSLGSSDPFISTLNMSLTAD
jgi:Fungal tRNA ligase phosphodiesterase domain